MNRRKQAPPAQKPVSTAIQVKFQQGLVLHQQGKLVEAERLYAQVLQNKPNHFDALHLLGVIALQTRRAQRSVELITKAIGLNSNFSAPYSNLGNGYRDLKRFEEALASYDKAIALKPDYATYNNRGVVLGDLKRPAEALESCNKAIALKPDYADAYNNRGNALGDLKRFAEALESYDRAIVLQPDNADAYNNRGNALRHLKRAAEALESYDKAIALKLDSDAVIYNNRGIALRDLKRPAEALESYERAIALKIDYADAYNNRGNALGDLKRPAEALENYDRAVALKPDYADAHWNLALCCLQLGDFASGWEGYEWRSKREDAHAEHRRIFTQPPWLGAETLEGSRILLHSEQGFGDTLQFCRYTNLVAALGAKVILEVQPTLLPLLTDLEGAAQVLPKGAPLPTFDYHCSLLSLPLAFKTDINTIPANIPYIRSDAARVSAWQDKLGIKTKPRVALVWSGSKGHKNDHNRSLPLRELLPLVDDCGEWISLQTEVRGTDVDLLASRTDIRHVGEHLKDFADTAAMIELMDLVVTVDTSVAHLAGAMGKPVWLLLPYNPDWRWLLDRNDSPWYPSARLFRQREIGNWAAVIDEVKSELRRVIC
jgi:hypothetical protein